MDKDGGGTIDKDEAVELWSGSFGEISAKEFFNAVDQNGDGEIEIHEFVSFWEVVKGSGHSEEEILEELEAMLSGEGWVGFSDLPADYKVKNRKSDNILASSADPLKQAKTKQVLT